jgi:hypothetical protein
MQKLILAASIAIVLLAGHAWAEDDSDFIENTKETSDTGTKNVSGENLSSEASRKIEKQKNGNELLFNAIAQYPQSAYQFEVGSPVVKETDVGNNTVSIAIPVIIKWNKEFIEELKQAISHVAVKAFGRVKVEALNYDTLMASKVVCMSTYALKRSGKADCYALDRKIINEEIPSLLNLPSRAKSYALSVSMLDSKNKPIETYSYAFTSKDNFSKRTHIATQKQGGAITSLFSLFGAQQAETEAPTVRKTEYNDRKAYELFEMGGGFLPPNILWRSVNSSYDYFMILENGEHRVNVVLEIDVKKLKEVAKIEVSMDRFE